MRLIVGANRWETKAGGRAAMNKGKSKWKALFRRNPADASRRNVAHHYDVGNDLYRLFLDDDLQYSCAYFTDPANSLEQAQSDKKAHIAAKLDLKPGQRVLDIGCGWGGTALYLNRVADVDVLGVTLSEEQLKVARERAEAAGVVGPGQVRADRLSQRRPGASTGSSRSACSNMSARRIIDEFFAKCRDLLTDDGVMLLHTIGKLGKAAAPDPFTDKYIFPGYHLPSLSSDGGGERAGAADHHRRRDAAAPLCLHAAALAASAREAARDKIVALYDERFFRMWEFYLAGGWSGSRAGRCAITRCNMSATAARCRSRATI